MTNISALNATICQLSDNTSESVLNSGTEYLPGVDLDKSASDPRGSECQDCFDFNGVPVVFSPINVNYNGESFQSQHQVC